MNDLQRYIQKRLDKSPEFQKEWDESRLDYEVAQQIIQLRKMQGMTQKELAEKIHTKQSEISRIENGDQNISLDKLNKIAQAMGAEVLIEIKTTHQLQK